MREIDIATLEKKLDEAGTLVDVREADEYVAARVPQARLIPMGQLPARLNEIPRDEPVYLICRSGNRSGAMLDLLLAQGFDAYNVAGGTQAWVESGRPVDQGVAR